MQNTAKVVDLNKFKATKAATEKMQGSTELKKCESIEDSLKACYFPVEEVALNRADDYAITTHKAIVRTDTNETLSIVGKDYKVVQNKDIFASFNKALQSSNLDLEGLNISVDTAYNGARSYVRYELPAHQVTVGDCGKDNINLQFLVMNSYDGTTAFKSLLGGFRTICANGMVLGNSFAQHYGKHTKGLNVDHAADKLRIAAEMYTQNAEAWKRMYDTRVTGQHVESVVLRISKSKKVQQYLRDQFEREAKALGRTEWALYNAITHWSTHADMRESSQANQAAVITRREDTVRSTLTLLKAA